MPFIRNGVEVIADAYERGFTLPAFNVCSAEMVRACVEAAEEERAPVILQTYPADLDQIAPEQMATLVTSYAELTAIPVMLHLDHGADYEMVVRCLRAGYSSVMYDGAESSLEQVVEMSARLAALTVPQGVSLEVAADSFNVDSSTLSAPRDVARLADEGKATMVAVSVGSEHGQAKALDLALLADIARTAEHPLVLHGGSGISEADYAAARRCGVVKANIGSALYRTLREVWLESRKAVSHRQVYEHARSALRRVAREKIRLMGADGKA